MHLTAVTLLGENTVPILAALCRWLSDDAGIEIVPDPGPSGRSPDAAEVAAGADLVWGCGYLLCELIDSGRLDAEIVAAPVFDGQAEAVYHSVIVTANDTIGSLDDAHGGCLAINESVSWSGHRALTAHLADLGADLSIFDRVVETGSHAASVDTVARSRADVAAIDHTVWEWLVAQAGVPARVRVVDRTRDWPAPPFAVRRRLPASERRSVVDRLLALPAGSVPGLTAVARATLDTYAPLRPA